METFEELLAEAENLAREARQAEPHKQYEARLDASGMLMMLALHPETPATVKVYAREMAGVVARL